MNPLENIKKYKRLFKANEKNNKSNFTEYLKENNLTIIEFLINIGLNKELIKGFNYKEIENEANKKFNFEEFPNLDVLSEEPLCVHINSESLGTITLGNAHVIFDFSNVTKLEHNEQKNICFTAYYLVGCFIRKIDVNVLMLHNDDNYDYSELEFEVNETICDSDGKNISNNSYFIKIKQGVNGVLFSDMLRPLYCGSIEPGLYNFLELIAKGKIKKENIIIDIHHPIVQKK